MKDIRWQHVTMVLGVLGVLGWLTYEGKDGATVIAGVLALLGALGFVAYQQSEIKQTAATIEKQTNGAQSELMRQLEAKDHRHREEMATKDRMIRQLQQENTDLALKVPPPAAEPEAPVGG